MRIPPVFALRSALEFLDACARPADGDLLTPVKDRSPRQPREIGPRTWATRRSEFCENRGAVERNIQSQRAQATGWAFLLRPERRRANARAHPRPYRAPGLR